MIKDRKMNTIYFGAFKYSSVFALETKVSLDKYQDGVRINREAMFDVVPSVERIRSYLDSLIGFDLVP